MNTQSRQGRGPGPGPTPPASGCWPATAARTRTGAAWTLSTYEFLSNTGMVIADGPVLLLGRNWPDLVVGLGTATVAA